jgi:hypothetical protein
MVMEQYPDTIVVTVVTPATQNSTTLVWTPGGSTNYTLKCRVEANNSGRKIPGADGELIDYAFTLYLPQMATVIPDGSVFSLSSLSNGTISGTTKKSFNGQLNSRIWV